MLCSDPFQLDAPDSGLEEMLAETEGLPIGDRLRALRPFDLPAPGMGRTRLRFQRLAEIAAVDLSLARLAEGHFDAKAILDEAEITFEEDHTFAVWVSGSALSSKSLNETTVLSGCKQFCSGYGSAERALVDGAGASGTFLYLIDANSPSAVDSSWPAVGMADSASVTLNFEECPVIGPVGVADFYRTRPGFWNGSANVAACWYGGALGLARRARHFSGSSADKSPIVGEIAVSLAQMRHALMQTADDIDNCPTVDPSTRELRAMLVRDIIYSGCNRVHSLSLELSGSELSTHCASQARALADLPIYLRQYHPARDRARMAELLDGFGRGDADDE